MGPLSKGDIRGYLAFVLTTLLFVIPFIPPPFGQFDMAVGLPVLILAVFLGLSGWRSRNKGGRFAARLSLVVLFITMLTSVALGWVAIWPSLDVHR